jgi:hypothetical protein
MGVAYRMRHLLSLKIAIGLLVVLVVLAAKAERYEPAGAQVVLERFLGEWTTHTQIRHFGPPAREFNTRGKAVCQQTLEGRFFEFRSQSVPPGESDLQIMTCDEKTGQYRQWVFASDGYSHEADGTWDPSTSTLRWTGKNAESSFVIEDRWITSDRLDWTLERTDAAGKQIQTINGTLNRAVLNAR